MKPFIVHAYSLKEVVFVIGIFSFTYRAREVLFKLRAFVEDWAETRTQKHATTWGVWLSSPGEATVVLPFPALGPFCILGASGNNVFVYRGLPFPS